MNYENKIKNSKPLLLRLVAPQPHMEKGSMAVVVPTTNYLRDLEELRSILGDAVSEFYCVEWLDKPYLNGFYAKQRFQEVANGCA